MPTLNQKYQCRLVEGRSYRPSKNLTFANMLSEPNKNNITLSKSYWLTWQWYGFHKMIGLIHCSWKFFLRVFLFVCSLFFVCLGFFYESFLTFSFICWCDAVAAQECIYNTRKWCGGSSLVTTVLCILQYRELPCSQVNQQQKYL